MKPLYNDYLVISNKTPDVWFVCFKHLQILEKDSLKPHRTVYQELVNESNGGPHHVIFTPRDQDQVRNFRKKGWQMQQIVSWCNV